MPSQSQYDALYIDIAYRVAMMSKAKRRKVGAIIVQDGSILSYGYNGTPRGCDNICETSVDGKSITLPQTIHSEINCLLKLIKTGVKPTNVTMYLTTLPCYACAVFMYQSEIVKEVVYHNTYRDLSGVEFLKSMGITVRKFEFDELNKSLFNIDHKSLVGEE